MGDIWICVLVKFGGYLDLRTMVTSMARLLVFFSVAAGKKFGPPVIQVIHGAAGKILKWVDDMSEEDKILKTIKCDETKDWKIKKMDDGTAVITIVKDASSDWKSEMELPVGTKIDIMGWEMRLNNTVASDAEVKEGSHEDCWVAKTTRLATEPEKMRGFKPYKRIVCSEGVRDRHGKCQVADFYCESDNGQLVPVIRKHDAIMLMDPKCFPRKDGGGLVALANGKKVYSRGVKYNETFEIDEEWENFFDLLATYQNLQKIKKRIPKQHEADRAGIEKKIKVLEEKIFNIALTFWFQARWTSPTPDQYLPKDVVFPLIESRISDLQKQLGAAKKNRDDEKRDEIDHKLYALRTLIRPTS